MMISAVTAMIITKRLNVTMTKQVHLTMMDTVMMALIEVTMIDEDGDCKRG
jgi:hypothetical protein